MIPSYILMAISTAIPQPDRRMPAYVDLLDPAVEKAIRLNLREKKLIISFPSTGPHAFFDIVVPSRILSETYKKHPQGVLCLLTAVVDGGTPVESKRAALSAMALTGRPCEAAALHSVIDDELYDDVDPDWKITPRRYMQRLVRKAGK